MPCSKWKMRDILAHSRLSYRVFVTDGVRLSESASRSVVSKYRLNGNRNPIRGRERLAGSGPACGMEAACQSVDCRDDGDAGDVHGGAGQLHCERVASAYCGWAGLDAGRSDVGDHGVPGGERDHSAGRRVHDDVHRAQEVLHDLRAAVRRELDDVWVCAVAAV